MPSYADLGTAGAVHRVNSADEVSDLIESGKLTAGDEIIWANGTYKDQEIEFNGVDGTESAPITLRAQTPGGVILIGESTIRTNAKASPAVDAAKGEFDFVTSDVESQARPNDSKDIGADEYVSKKPAQPTVLSREQVGTTFLDRRSPQPSKSRKS